MKEDCFRIYLDVLMSRLASGVAIGQATGEAAEAVESYVAVMEEFADKISNLNKDND